MKMQIVNINPMQAAKVFSALYFVISLPLVAIMALPMLFSAGPKMPMLLLILMPIVYAFFGFILSLFGAWVYNLIASKIGGLEFTTHALDKD